MYGGAGGELNLPQYPFSADIIFKLIGNEIAENLIVQVVICKVLGMREITCKCCIFLQIFWGNVLDPPPSGHRQTLGLIVSM